jgi:AcrR family transcriptional regulator
MAMSKQAIRPTGGFTREERTRREILVATRALVERYGFAKLTLDDIAGALGKKKSFLYYYYSDKEAILAAAIEAESLDMQREVDKALAKESSGLAKVRTYILVCHQEIQKRLPILTQLRGEIQAKNRDTLGLLLEKSKELMKMDMPLLKELLGEGAHDGSMRPFDEREIEALAHFISLALHGIEYDYILEDADERFEENLRIALGTLEHGIAA